MTDSIQSMFWIVLMVVMILNAIAFIVMVKYVIEKDREKNNEDQQ